MKTLSGEIPKAQMRDFAKDRGRSLNDKEAHSRIDFDLQELGSRSPEHPTGSGGLFSHSKRENLHVHLGMPLFCGIYPLQERTLLEHPLSTGMELPSDPASCLRHFKIQASLRYATALRMLKEGKVLTHEKDIELLNGSDFNAACPLLENSFLSYVSSWVSQRVMRSISTSLQRFKLGSTLDSRVRKHLNEIFGADSSDWNQTPRNFSETRHVFLSVRSHKWSFRHLFLELE